MGTRIVVNGHELNTFDMGVEPGAEYLVTVGRTASSVKVERVIAEQDDAVIEENKILRELVLDLYNDFDGLVDEEDVLVADKGTSRWLIDRSDVERYRNRIRDLGMEVE